MVFIKISLSMSTDLPSHINFNNLSVPLLAKNAQQCAIYNQFKDYFPRCHVNDILTLLIQQEFPNATSIDDIFKTASQLNRDKRIEKLNYILQESGKNYKLSQIVKQKLSFLFDFKSFAECVNSRKKYTTTIENKKRKRVVTSDITTFPVYVQFTTQRIKTIYIVQFRDNQIHSFSVHDSESDMKLPLPYDIIYVNDTTFHLKENKMLINKKKNNCVDHVIDLSPFLQMEEQSTSSTLSNYSNCSNTQLDKYKSSHTNSNNSSSSDLSLFSDSHSTNDGNYIVKIEITETNELQFLLERL